MTGTPEGFFKTPASGNKTGTTIRWKPDIEVFTDIEIPSSYFEETLRRQAVVNDGLLFVYKNQTEDGFETKEYCY